MAGNDLGVLGVFHVPKARPETADDNPAVSPQHLLPAHGGAVQSLACDPSGRLLASKSVDGTLRLWRRYTWEVIALLDVPASDFKYPNVVFHPTEPVLAADPEVLRKSGEVLAVDD